MTTFICFVIAMVILYIMRLLTGGFDVTELTSYLLMLLLGTHVYLSTRKKAIYGIVIPIFIVVSFYPVYKLTNPAGITLVVLIGLYILTLGSLLGIWYKARKSDN